MRRLTERLPGTSALPVVEIATLPTPVEALDVDLPGRMAGLWVKRDDVTGDIYGGNKVRKLEFLIAEALARGARSVITFGAVGSNHVLATATYATRAGLDVHAVLTPQAHTSYLRTNLFADLATGATLHPVARAEDALRRAAEIRGMLRRRDGTDPFVIPFGGTSPRGTLGFVDAAFELAAQIEARELPEPAVVYVPLGSMGTSAGLAIGFAAVGLATRVEGIRVVPDQIASEELLASVVSDAVGELYAADPTFPRLTRDELRLEVRDEFLGDGYAVPTPAGLEAVAMAAQWGLKLETTYTGKALSALLADARGGRLDGDSVVFWNTYNSRPLDPPPVPVDDLAEELRAYMEGE